ncbi:hypothetical protein FIV42_09590 [Persicimonas caeni]|uniref:Uncharacterized protein n=1 Tax=Persicimonas caeni TaxID=2292766 RepID=A0A4Y6PRM7_PERCE|nr:hypothetical protein [Persicimonas caeni]QDG50978.1 hypothetical protein FIV42_09590 [Persicimonas caeni]QED32199.1 hypothetical protein FRD00_09585 [Persicimonas caeni]
MNDLLVHLGEAGGLSAPTAQLIAAILAILLIMVGAVLLIITLFGKWARAIENETDSRLLPTLAEDVLDADLQRIYRKSLMLDDQIAECFPTIASATGTELGRKARKFVVGLQATRFAAAQGLQSRRGEPSDMEARLERVGAVIEEALERLGVEGSAPSSPAEARQMLEALSEKLRA